MSFGDKLLLRNLCMHEHNIGVVAPSNIERLTGARRYYVHEMPVVWVKSGSRCPNKPESFVEVVEATTIDFSCVRTGPDKKTALKNNAAKASFAFR
jgi:hypothetical protein